MYHAAISILIAKGFPPTQKHIGHDWVQSVFARELVNRRKVFQGKFRRYFYLIHKLYVMMLIMNKPLLAKKLHNVN